MEKSEESVVKRAVCGAGSVIGSFCVVGAEGSPCVRTVDPALADVVHRNGDAQHRSERDDIRADMTVGERLKIPEGSATTLNMNGHKFDRNLTKNNKAEDDGEVILIMKGANLTINGGEGNDSHEVYIYKSINKDAKPVKENLGKGALITGGASKDGAGAIHIYDGGNLTMNQVTIAGCRAEDKGYGGGIYLENDSHRVELNNSDIIGCFATKDGGGIFATSSIPNYFSKRYLNLHLLRHTGIDRVFNTAFICSSSDLE